MKPNISVVNVIDWQLDITIKKNPAIFLHMVNNNSVLYKFVFGIRFPDETHKILFLAF